jgi:ATP-binding cassette subfamily B protein
MATARFPMLARWRALAGLMWSASRWRVAAFAAAVLAVGLVPTAVILLTGALVGAIPGAVGSGLSGPGGRAALLALGGLAAALAVHGLANVQLWRLTRVLNAEFIIEVHHTVARVVLGTPLVAPLEDPAFADELQAVREAERRGVLRRVAGDLSRIASMRLRAAGAFGVLMGFHWWAPVPLAAAWTLTNLLFRKATEKGITAGMDAGAEEMRRAEYLRGLAIEPAGAKEIRVFGLGPWVVGRYGDAGMGVLQTLWRSRSANPGLTAAATLSLAAAHALALGALALAAGHGALSVAALLVFVQAVIATSDFGIAGDAQWCLAQSAAAAERVASLRDGAGDRLLPAAPPPASAPAKLPAPAGPRKVAVQLHEVRFAYRGRERPTLDGLTLEIPAGQSLAIVGENGAGKSTLIKLLCGLYEPDSGRIAIDGAPPLQARDRVGVIFQDFVRYPLPLRENVAFGHLPLIGDGAALEEALRDAGAGALLETLPRGLDTVLSREFEGGADLSGGQWQRVALARALAAVRGGAGLLILDEPTAALDVRAETELFDRFLELTRDVTTVLVSHRLSSVRRADRIVVIDGGRVAEDGTHDQLMRRGGRYAAMFSLQAERFATDGAAAGEEVAHA